MFPLFRPLFFARRVRRALLAVPGVEGVRVYREVTIRRVVEVTGNNPEGVADWEYQLAAAVYDTTDALGGFVSHDLAIVPPGESIRWNARRARLRKAEMDALERPVGE